MLSLIRYILRAWGEAGQPLAIVKNNRPSLIEPLAIGIDAVAQPRIGGTAF